MGTKVIELTDAQIEKLDNELYEVACNCNLREDDNVQYDTIEIDFDGLIVEFAIHINCYNEWETSATYDQPAEGGCEIDVEIDAAIAYDDNDNEIEVVCKQSVFEYEFCY